MEETKFQSMTIRISADTSELDEALDRSIAKAERLGNALDYTAKLTFKDVQQALYRFAIRVSEKEDATPAELDAMTRVVGL